MNMYVVVDNRRGMPYKKRKGKSLLLRRRIGKAVTFDMMLIGMWGYFVSSIMFVSWVLLGELWYWFIQEHVLRIVKYHTEVVRDAAYDFGLTVAATVVTCFFNVLVQVLPLMYMYCCNQDNRINRARFDKLCTRAREFDPGFYVSSWDYDSSEDLQM